LTPDEVQAIKDAAVHKAISRGVGAAILGGMLIGCFATLVFLGVVMDCSKAPDLATTDLDRVWKSICLVESENDPLAFNKVEDAVGIAQIRPCCLQDCNTIVGEPRWCFSDRFDPEESKAMFEAYTTYYCKKHDVDTTPENRARIWNGGPHGFRKGSTLDYWGRVQRRMPQ
jgi:hypothetical protein